MRLAYCTWGMMTLDVDDAVPGIARIGYRALELAVTLGRPSDLYTFDAAKRARTARLLREHGLALTAVAGHSSMCEDDAEKNRVNMQRLRDTIDLTAELTQPGETPITVSLVGGAETAWDSHREVVAERVHMLGDYAAGRGVILAVEPHSGTALDTPEKAAWLIERVRHPAVRLNFDISHFDIIGIGIDECVPQMAPLSAYTHVKDQRGRYPQHEFLTPGSGPFDFVHYLKAMHQAGYRGVIAVEVSVMVQRKPGYDPFVDAALGYYALKHAFNESGVPLQE